MTCGIPWYSAYCTGGFREMLNGLMDEWDDLRVVCEAEKELEKSLKAPSCRGLCDDGLVALRQHAVE